jgi:hypothetical protein
MSRVRIKSVFSFAEKVAEIPGRHQRKIVQSHVFYKSIFESWLNVILVLWNTLAKSVALYDRASYYSSSERTEESDEPLLNIPPHDRIQFFENFLENKFNIDRELFQRQVHQMCIAVVAHLIVGKEWKFVGRDIVKQRGWEQLIKSLSFFAMSFRRAGKTSSIQMLAAALVILVCGISIAIFATNKRISMALGKGMLKMIIEAGYEDMIYTNSMESITLRMNENPKTERTIFMSPGNPDIYILYCSFLFFLTRCFDTPQKNLIFFQTLSWILAEQRKSVCVCVTMSHTATCMRCKCRCPGIGEVFCDRCYDLVFGDNFRLTGPEKPKEKLQSAIKKKKKTTKKKKKKKKSKVKKSDMLSIDNSLVNLTRF